MIKSPTEAHTLKKNYPTTKQDATSLHCQCARFNHTANRRGLEVTHPQKAGCYKHEMLAITTSEMKPCSCLHAHPLFFKRQNPRLLLLELRKDDRMCCTWSCSMCLPLQEDIIVVPLHALCCDLFVLLQQAADGITQSSIEATLPIKGVGFTFRSCKITTGTCQQSSIKSPWMVTK